jgi:hypothetical protein
VVKLVDTRDLKFLDRKVVRVDALSVASMFCTRTPMGTQPLTSSKHTM